MHRVSLVFFSPQSNIVTRSVQRLGRRHTSSFPHGLGQFVNSVTYVLEHSYISICLSQHSIHRAPIRPAMYIGLQDPRRLNLLRLRLQLLHIPIHTHVLPLQEPRLLTAQPQDKMRRQFHYSIFSSSAINHRQEKTYHRPRTTGQLVHGDP